MKKRLVIVLIVISIIIVGILISQTSQVKQLIEKVRIDMYGLPIDETTNIVNNQYFGISKDARNAKDTTKGINEALQYCKKNSIAYVKFEKGEYLINGSIEVPANIEIDLNSSTIRYEENANDVYVVFRMLSVENVKIKNGFIVGDRQKHHYIGNSTHEWGMGISIKSSNNIEIDTLDISNMTGDAIYIRKATDEDSNPHHIQIKNCKLHDNRRQGISIISGEKIEINHNEIYKMDGTNPQSGIDLESNSERDKINQINIHHNKFYNFGKQVAIILYSQIYNVKINENTIFGSISIYETQEKTQIENNVLNNGRIYANFNKKDSVLNQIYILNNVFSNYDILYNETIKELKIEGNVKK